VSPEHLLPDIRPRNRRIYLKINARRTIHQDEHSYTPTAFDSEPCRNSRWPSRKNIVSFSVGEMSLLQGRSGRGGNAEETQKNRARQPKQAAYDKDKSLFLGKG